MNWMLSNTALLTRCFSGSLLKELASTTEASALLTKTSLDYIALSVTMFPCRRAINPRRTVLMATAARCTNHATAGCRGPSDAKMSFLIEAPSMRTFA